MNDKTGITQHREAVEPLSSRGGTGRENVSVAAAAAPLDDAAEKAALAWLEGIATEPNTVGGAKLFARTLKAMLAQPRMPEEPSEEALRLIAQRRANYDWASQIYRALYAHLTVPKTKTVWRVSWDGQYTECTTPEMLAREIERRTVEQGRTITIKAEEVPA